MNKFLLIILLSCGKPLFGMVHYFYGLALLKARVYHVEKIGQKKGFASGQPLYCPLVRLLQTSAADKAS